jgi:hypothetical protein
MDKIIVYFDDAAFARRQLASMRTSTAAPAQGTHWILVACPPRMARHISKWGSHSARQNWRAKWADKLFAEIAPEMQAGGDRVTKVLANGPLVEVTQTLQQQHGAAQVLDARRPKFGQDLQPVTPDQAPSGRARWSVPGAIVGMGAALVLAVE